MKLYQAKLTPENLENGKNFMNLNIFVGFYKKRSYFQVSEHLLLCQFLSRFVQKFIYSNCIIKSNYPTVLTV